jgi:hypothetical protein
MTPRRPRGPSAASSQPETTRTCASWQVTFSLTCSSRTSARQIGSAVQQTNRHPFRHGQWLFMHNGFNDGFATIKRDLVLMVDGTLFPEIQRTAKPSDPEITPPTLHQPMSRWAGTAFRLTADSEQLAHRTRRR